MMFGPLHSCVYPRIFCSIKVRNAMAKRTGVIMDKKLIKNIMLKRGIEPLVIKV